MIITYEKLLGHLAMSNYPDTEVDHLRSLTAVLLKALLPSDYRLTGAGLYVVRELIAKNVFFPLIDLLSDPAWLNRTVVHILKEDNAPEKEDSVPTDDGSLTSSDHEDVSNNAEECPSPIDEDGESLEVEDLVEVNRAKPEKDLKVIFSVAENADDLKLNITYDGCAADDVNPARNKPKSGLSLISRTVEEDFESASRKGVEVGVKARRSSDYDDVILDKPGRTLDMNHFGEGDHELRNSVFDPSEASLNRNGSRYVVV